MESEYIFTPIEKGLSELEDGVYEFYNDEKHYRMHFKSQAKAIQIEVKESDSDEYFLVPPDLQTENYGLQVINNDKTHDVMFGTNNQETS
jgi:hypothetical protein